MRLKKCIVVGDRPEIFCGILAHRVLLKQQTSAGLRDMGQNLLDIGESCGYRIGN
jgi:hypothetical protein